MTTTAPGVPDQRVDDRADETAARSVGGPVSAGWREATLTRAQELEALSRWIWRSGACDGAAQRDGHDEELLAAVGLHITAAREAADNRRWFSLSHKAARMERALSNLDAAEAHLMQLAPPAYLLGQMPSVLNHVQRHLRPSDARRKHFESIAVRLGVMEPDEAHKAEVELTIDQKWHDVDLERQKIVSAMRAASSAALREQLQLHSFRKVVVATTLLLSLLMVGFAVMGAISPTMIPLCFGPEAAAEVVVVCPTSQSDVKPLTPGADVDIDEVVRTTVTPLDVIAVQIVGLAAAAIAAAAAVRNIRGSSERYGLPVALAILKLPTGAMTAVLGLLLMRGQFIPGLSALDSSAQILAWALVFGYGQQVFTRMVDQQANTVLNGIRTPKTTAPAA